MSPEIILYEEGDRPGASAPKLGLTFLSCKEQLLFQPESATLQEIARRSPLPCCTKQVELRCSLVVFWGWGMTEHEGRGHVDIHN